MSDIDLSAPEVQDAIKAAIKDATEGLISKRDELLREVKKLKEGRDIKPEDVAKLEDQLDTLKGELGEAQRAAKQAAKDAEKAHKARTDAEASIAKLLVDNGLSDALVKAGVTNPVHQKAAKALLREGVTLADDNGQKVAKVGDKALHDYIAEWAGTDEGKHFVTAADTSGGGAGSGRRTVASAKELTRAAFDALDPVARAAHFQGGGVVID